MTLRPMSPDIAEITNMLIHVRLNPTGIQTFSDCISTLKVAEIKSSHQKLRDAVRLAAMELDCLFEDDTKAVLQRIREHEKKYTEIGFPAAATVGGAAIRQALRR